MKTFIMITIILFLAGCGNSGSNESSTTPPQPNNATADIKPPASPVLE